MRILAIECSENPASCAVIENGRLICESYISTGLTHSRTLMPMVEAMLKNAEIDLSTIERFAVTVGPGSFTGLRIGLASVKGMALGTGADCCGVSTLEAAAYGAQHIKGIICPVMDARCNQVYNALFYSNGESVKRMCEDRALMIEDLEKELDSLKSDETYKDADIILTGNGAELCASKMSDKLEVKLAPMHVRSQRAFYAALLAESAQPVTAEQLSLSYLRLPQAERELKARTNNV